ncbi:hypothetical protein [Roseovarius mucosus]|uniref:hypothetical protein n=1 Tax=Roseovarius mucosus TaxID=215743 RepID=UPI001C310EAF|nr:hypothetical protein [Roseovarius mucosus]|tara:strand:- start:168 stop:347 length:180 start_codon:yes stop_codon:yes gene_type:complete
MVSTRRRRLVPSLPKWAPNPPPIAGALMASAKIRSRVSLGSKLAVKHGSIFLEFKFKKI